jgi:hypothetical protein
VPAGTQLLIVLGCAGPPESNDQAVTPKHCAWLAGTLTGRALASPVPATITAPAVIAAASAGTPMIRSIPTAFLIVQGELPW